MKRKMERNESERKAVEGRKPYLKPQTEVIHMKSEESCMIVVSGKTTPEESQAKGNSLWGDDDSDISPSRNLWDDEE